MIGVLAVAAETGSEVFTGWNGPPSQLGYYIATAVTAVAAAVTTALSRRSKKEVADGGAPPASTSAHVQGDLGMWLSKRVTDLEAEQKEHKQATANLRGRVAELEDKLSEWQTWWYTIPDALRSSLPKPPGRNRW